MTDEKREEPNTAKDISLLTDAVNQILIAANCPHSFRGFIDCLVGFAKGKDEIEVSDIDMARRARPDSRDIKDASARKWVSRMRTDLNEWQRQYGLDFVTGKHGKIKGIAYFSSSYELPLIRYAEQVISDAQKDTLWRLNPHQAIAKAANNLIKALNPNPGKVQKNQKSYELNYKEVHRGLSSARSNLESVVKYLEDNDTGIHDTKTYNGHVDLLDELEQLIKQLKERVGYYGSWPSDEGNGKQGAEPPDSP